MRCDGATLSVELKEKLEETKKWVKKLLRRDHPRCCFARDALCRGLTKEEKNSFTQFIFNECRKQFKKYTIFFFF